MNITNEQLMDIITLSILAVSTKSDPTIPPCSTANEGYRSIPPYIGELLEILDEGHPECVNEENQLTAKALNKHIATLRAGMEIAKCQQSENC